MSGIQIQMMKLLSLSALGSFRLGGVWVALLAGLSLAIGYKAANLLDAAMDLICLILALGLEEVTLEPAYHEKRALQRMLDCVRETVNFLIAQARARRIMLMNALAGAISILLSFFLQAKLPQAGLEGAYLGPALFVMGLGGAVGARFAEHSRGMRYIRLYGLCLGGVLLGLALGASGIPLLMIAGGFAAGAFDDLLQVRTNTLLNDQFPSSQRSTLVSVSSLCFSLVMIVLSPLAGMLFERIG